MIGCQCFYLDFNEENETNDQGRGLSQTARPLFYRPRELNFQLIRTRERQQA